MFVSDKARACCTYVYCCMVYISLKLSILFGKFFGVL